VIAAQARFGTVGGLNSGQVKRGSWFHLC
jgi:hypothetical protein